MVKRRFCPPFPFNYTRTFTLARSFSTLLSPNKSREIEKNDPERERDLGCDRSILEREREEEDLRFGRRLHPYARPAAIRRKSLALNRQPLLDGPDSDHGLDLYQGQHPLFADIRLIHRNQHQQNLGASDFIPIKKIKIFYSLGEEHAIHAHHSDCNIRENLVAKLLKYVEWATWDCGCYNIGHSCYNFFWP